MKLNKTKYINFKLILAHNIAIIIAALYRALVFLL